MLGSSRGRSGSLGAGALAAALLAPAGARASGPVQYYGGRVISNVEVVAVFWTSGVAPMITQRIGGFYAAITRSSYLDWLGEYDTAAAATVDHGPGSGQHIGRGSFGGAFTIDPSNAATTLAPVDIGAELARQIAAGALPPPSLDAGGNVNTLYMIEFPSGFTFRSAGDTSCRAFCGLHWTVVVGGKSVPFAVLPNIQDCGGVCGSGFDDATIVHSHEMMEAITDAESGLADQDAAAPSRPEAWVGQDVRHEIADVCFHGFDDDHGVVAGYAVQKIWSNVAGACVLGAAGGTDPDGSADSAAGGGPGAGGADAGGGAGAAARTAPAADPDASEKRSEGGCATARRMAGESGWPVLVALSAYAARRRRRG